MSCWKENNMAKYVNVVIYRQNSNPIRISNVVSVEEKVELHQRLLVIGALKKGTYQPGHATTPDYKQTYKFYLSQLLGYRVVEAVAETEEEIL